jgi:peptidoglycan LD-endopeptidase CwlK
MPATFSAASEARLKTCHPDLQRLFREVLKHWPCQVLEGHRGQEAQDRAFREGKSKLQWPNGNHNSFPSRAVDVAPFLVDTIGPPSGAPLVWNDAKRFYAFSGFVIGIAIGLGLKIRWGGDWDGDRDLGDQKFNDLVHFELLP